MRSSTSSSAAYCAREIERLKERERHCCVVGQSVESRRVGKPRPCRSASSSSMSATLIYKFLNVARRGNKPKFLLSQHLLGRVMIDEHRLRP